MAPNIRQNSNSIFKRLKRTGHIGIRNVWKLYKASSCFQEVLGTKCNGVMKSITYSSSLMTIVLPQSVKKIVIMNTEL